MHCVKLENFRHSWRCLNRKPHEAGHLTLVFADGFLWTVRLHVHYVHNALPLVWRDVWATTAGAGATGSQSWQRRSSPSALQRRSKAIDVFRIPPKTSSYHTSISYPTRELKSNPS